MRSPLPLAAAAALLCLATAGPAAAHSIPTGCSHGTCQGGIYELFYDPTPVAADDASRTWRITLRIDPSGYSGAGFRIDDVAFKVSSQLDGLALLDAPGGPGDWSALAGGINASGCYGNGSNGFGCATSNDDDAAGLPHAGLYEWVFDVVVPLGTPLKTDPWDASVKVRFVDALGNKVGALVSEHVTLQVIPEPASLLLLGAGLLGLAARRSGPASASNGSLSPE